MQQKKLPIVINSEAAKGLGTISLLQNAFLTLTDAAPHMAYLLTCFSLSLR